MHSPENQPEPQLESQFDSSMKYFDPEQFDASEQEFAVSLEKNAAPPVFEIEPEENIVRQERAAYPSGARDAAVECEASDDAANPADIANAPALEISEPQVVGESNSDWRNQVSRKVSNYRSRRPRKEHYPSLQLQFDEEPNRRPPKDKAEDTQPIFNVPAAKEFQPPVEAPVVRIAPPIQFETTARVLEFPRPAAPEREELAEPVLDRPRIIEAPELLPPPPAMGGILIEPVEEPVAERRPGFEVPLQSATLNQRVVAALADATIVGGAVGLFGYVAWRIIGAMPPWRTGVILLAGMFALLWAAYQYAFLVFCSKTVGLLTAKLQIRRFDGSVVSRRLRRWRAVASILSFASLGLGYLWYFFDEDCLCWHDRITRTHLAPRDPGP